jgi:hypothetical protein
MALRATLAAWVLAAPVLAALVLAAPVLALPAGVVAQTETEPASREALIASAERAADRGAHQEALELALRARELRETPSLVLFIGQQQALSGRIEEAIESARRCFAEAERDLALRNRRIIRSTCRSLERELMRRVGLVTVSVAAPREDLRITINGSALPRDRWGRSVVVAPGDVLIEASAGTASMRQRLRVEAGEESSIELHFESGELVSRERRPSIEPPEPGAPSSIEPVWLAIPLGAAAAFGIAAAVTGAVVLDRGMTYAALYELCASADVMACDAARSVRSEGETLRDTTNGMVTAMAISLAASIVLGLFVDLGGPWPLVRF